MPYNPNETNPVRNGYSYEMNIGIEKRKTISDVFQLYIGYVLSAGGGYSYKYSISSNGNGGIDSVRYDSDNYFLGLGLPIGCTYKINNKFSVGIETFSEITFYYYHDIGKLEKSGILETTVSGANKLGSRSYLELGSVKLLFTYKLFKK